MFFYVALHDVRKQIRNKLPFKDVLIFCLFMLLSFCLLGYWGSDYLLFIFFRQRFDHVITFCHLLPYLPNVPTDLISYSFSLPHPALSQKFLAKPIRKNTKSKQNETHSHTQKKQGVFSVLANYSLA